MNNNREHDFNSLKILAGDRLVSSYSDFSNDRSLLAFLCDKCDDPFMTTSYLYKQNAHEKSCVECRLQSENADSVRARFIHDSEKVHGKYYDYSLVPKDPWYEDNVTIICPKHGEIEVHVLSHLKKAAGCQHCEVENVTSVSRSDYAQFMLDANNVHEFKYRYDTVKYTTPQTAVTITCPKHGMFEQTPEVHLRGVGCAICTATARSVKEIQSMLDASGVEYSTEKTFPGCNSKQGRALRFDIFVPEKNLCIECDGIHHFQPTKYSSDVTDTQAEEYYTIQRENDAIKDRYCAEHNIRFIRIPYTAYHPDAILKKYMSGLSTERFIYTWDDFKVDVRHLIDHIKTYNYSHFAVYGISRGGLPFAVPISNHFDSTCEFGIVRFQRYDGTDKVATIEIAHEDAELPIFVIDDLISSGKTMEQVTTELQRAFPKAPIHPIVIFGDENESDIFFLKEHPKQWIVFPYEV